MLLKHKNTIALLVSLIVLFGIIWGIVLPNAKDIISISSAIQKEKRDLEIKYERGLLLKKLRRDMEKIEDKRQLIDDVFITAGEELDFVNELETLASRFGITLTLLLDTSALETIRTVKKLPLRLHLDGDFVKMIEYLREIEKKDYYINISELEFTGNKTARGDVNASFEGVIYTKL